MRRLPILLVVALGLLAACGDSSPTGVTVNFVGNSTCSTSNQSTVAAGHQHRAGRSCDR